MVKKSAAIAFPFLRSDLKMRGLEKKNLILKNVSSLKQKIIVIGYLFDINKKAIFKLKSPE
jgi:hypothetical protein